MRIKGNNLKRDNDLNETESRCLHFSYDKINSKMLLNLPFVSKSLQVPSLDTVAIWEVSTSKAMSYTPELCPPSVSWFTGTMSWNSPTLLKTTSHTFASGVKPENFYSWSKYVQTNQPKKMWFILQIYYRLYTFCINFYVFFLDETLNLT